ncbi:MAG: hypothetical protein K2G32_08970 [Oscillospiraceae bacterium]|nr:hypothetical protein [Oscillospiraceae bacterium]
MKKALITATLSAALLLSGCAGDKENSTIPENTIPSITDTLEESRSEGVTPNETDSVFPPEGITAPLITTPHSIK